MAQDIFSRLAAPFPPERVSWRVGATSGDKKKGLALAYIDSRDVMERLDEVVGPDNWQNDYPHANGKTVCRIGLRINNEWVWKANGAGDTDVEAEKGALSDALKRAAVMWGIGRYLYDVKSPWVEIEPAGKSFKIKDGEYRKLEAVLRGNAAPEPTVPASAETNAKAHFLSSTKEKIAAFQDRDSLLTWWNSKEQKGARAFAEITKTELALLMSLVTARRDELTPDKKDAA